jgi:uncharacterized protein with GYD domain
MTGELETTREIAKAVQETGKAVQGVTELLGNVGGWMSGVMGTTAEDFVALVVGDRLKALRMRMQLEHLDSVRRKWEEILERRGIESVDPIGPKHAIPLFDAMADEADETLQELWARLLANAMDPTTDIVLEQVLIDALKGFEPIDAVVFREHALMNRRARKHIVGVADALPYRETQVLVSAERIEHLGCFAHEKGKRGVYMLSPLGTELWLAIKGDGAD